jgi:hypothetical protein
MPFEKILATENFLLQVGDVRTSLRCALLRLSPDRDLRRTLLGDVDSCITYFHRASRDASRQ